MKIVFMNNAYFEAEKCTIPINDRGFLLGDGIFETIRIYSGKALFLNLHWDRLKLGAEFLEIPLKITYEELKKVISHLIEKNNLKDQEASVRLTLTRGPGPRGITVNNAQPTFLATISPLIAQQEKMLSVLVSSIRRNELSPSSKIKSLHYLDNILARREAEKAGFDEAILLNTRGNLSEATIANLFFVRNEILCTPQIEDGALPGITREILLNVAKELGIKTKLASFSPQELLLAEEAFLSSSLLGIKAIWKVNDTVISEKPGLLTARLAHFLTTYNPHGIKRKE